VVIGRGGPEEGAFARRYAFHRPRAGHVVSVNEQPVKLTVIRYGKEIKLRSHSPRRSVQANFVLQKSTQMDQQDHW